VAVAQRGPRGLDALARVGEPPLDVLQPQHRRVRGPQSQVGDQRVHGHVHRHGARHSHVVVEVVAVGVFALPTQLGGAVRVALVRGDDREKPLPRLVLVVLNHRGKSGEAGDECERWRVTWCGPPACQGGRLRNVPAPRPGCPIAPRAGGAGPRRPRPPATPRGRRRRRRPRRRLRAACPPPRRRRTARAWRPWSAAPTGGPTGRPTGARTAWRWARPSPSPASPAPLPLPPLGPDPLPVSKEP